VQDHKVLSNKMEIRKHVAIRKPEPQVHNATHCGSKQQRDLAPQSISYCLLAPLTYRMLFFVHISFTVNGTLNTAPKRLQQQDKDLLFLNSSMNAQQMQKSGDCSTQLSCRRLI